MLELRQGQDLEKYSENKTCSILSAISVNILNNRIISNRRSKLIEHGTKLVNKSQDRFVYF